jgi:hypothetical protein
MKSVMRDKPDQSRRSFWLKQLHQWHWISSAICLVGMLVFAITGITLNHAAQIESRPAVSEQRAPVPDALRNMLGGMGRSGEAPLPPELSVWIADTFRIDVDGRIGEWSDGEIYVALPRPGGDAWLNVDLAAGEAVHEVTDRGWVSYLNDLHKGRNTGSAWFWFLDAFAVGCLVFCLTGLFLLQMHARTRVLTWPMAGLGLVIPMLLIVLFIH